MHLKGKKIDLFSINITMTNDSNTKKRRSYFTPNNNSQLKFFVCEEQNDYFMIKCILIYNEMQVFLFI